MNGLMPVERMEDDEIVFRVVDSLRLGRIDGVLGEVVDDDAIVIGELYERSNSSLVDAVMARLKCGQRLAEKKASLAHGEWGDWLHDNAGVLGFSSRFTAAKLMKAVRNVPPAAHLDVESAVKISRKMWGHDAHVSANSGNNEWYTPADIIDRARAVLGEFDLDPASSLIANETVGAAQIFTAADDGLSQEWPIGRIWMNPPYAQPLIAQFCERFASETVRGSTGIALVNNATETSWFNAIAECASAICFLRGRVRYLNPEGEPSGAPLQGQAIIYLGDDVSAFKRVFAPIGYVVVPA
jgi:phage N-6-adenine-methyltransferase